MVLTVLESYVAGSVLGENFVVGSSGESADSEEKNVEDEPQTENIANGVVFGFHVFDVDDFRSHVAWSSTPNEEVLFGIRELC